MNSRTKPEIYEQCPQRTNSRKSITLSDKNYSKRGQTLRNILESAIIKSESANPSQHQIKDSEIKGKPCLPCENTTCDKDKHHRNQEEINSVIDAIEIVRKHILSKQVNQRQKKNLVKKSKVDPDWVKTVLQFLRSRELKSAIELCTKEEKTRKDSIESDSSDTTRSESQSDITSCVAATYPRRLKQHDSRKSVSKHRHRSSDNTVIPWVNDNTKHKRKDKRELPAMCSKGIQTVQYIKKPFTPIKALEQITSQEHLNSGHNYVDRREYKSRTNISDHPVNYTNFENVEKKNDNSAASYKPNPESKPRVFHPFSQVGYITHCDIDTQTGCGSIFGFNNIRTSFRSHERLLNIIGRPQEQYSSNTTKNSRHFAEAEKNSYYKTPSDNFNQKYKYFSNEFPERQNSTFPRNNTVKNELYEDRFKKLDLSDGTVTSLQPPIQHSHAKYNFIEGNAKFEHPSRKTEHYNSNKIYEASPSMFPEIPTRVKSDQPIYSKEVYESFPVIDRTDQPKYATNRDNPVRSKADNSQKYFEKLGPDVNKREKCSPCCKRDGHQGARMDIPQLNLQRVGTKEYLPSPEEVEKNTLKEQTLFPAKYDPIIMNVRQSSAVQEKIGSNSGDEASTSAEYLPKSKKFGSKIPGTNGTSNRYEGPFRQNESVHSWSLRRQTTTRRLPASQSTRRNPLCYVPQRYRSSSILQKHSKTDPRDTTACYHQAHIRKKECQRANKHHGSPPRTEQKWDHSNTRIINRNKKVHNEVPEQNLYKTSPVNLTDVAEGSDSTIQRTRNRESNHGTSHARYPKRRAPIKTRSPIADRKANYSLRHQERHIFQSSDQKSKYIKDPRSLPASSSHKEARATEHTEDMENRYPTSSDYAQLAIEMIFRQKEFFQNHLKSLSEICKILVKDNGVNRSTSESDDASLSNYQLDRRNNNRNSKALERRVKPSMNLPCNDRQCDHPQSRDISRRTSVTSNAPSRQSWREPKRDMNIHEEDNNYPQTQRKQYLPQKDFARMNQTHNDLSFLTQSK